MIEVWEMLRYRVRLCRDKLFRLMLNPRILGLSLKMLVRQARCRVGANFYTEEVVNLEKRMKVRARVEAAASRSGPLEWSQHPPRSGPQISTAPLGPCASLFCKKDLELRVTLKALGPI